MLRRTRDIVGSLLGAGREDDLATLRVRVEELAGELDSLARRLKDRELRLEDAQALNRALTSMPHALILTQDAAGRILTLNHHGVWLTGYGESELAGQRFTELLPDAVLQPDLKFRLDELPVSGHHYSHQAELIRKDGDQVAMQWYHTVYDCPASGEKRVLTVGLDISDQKIAEDHLGWLSSHDPLTGLYNRRRFLEELDQTLATCERYGQTFAVMMIDLDQFKDINETSGHHVGDRLLQRVSDVLRAQARTSDIVSRLGGDEFAIIVQMTGADSAELIAARFCNALDGLEVEGNGTTHRISASIGAALFPVHGANADELLANADIAMYQAKEKGRKAWHMYTPEEHTRTRVHERVYWDEQVKRALSGNTLNVHFQPILDVRHNEVTHYEALLRVKDGGGKILSPARFISSAERNGLIHQVDELVIDRVISTLADLQRSSVRARLSVNLSGASFHNPKLVAHIEGSIERHGVDPTSLIFEITETAAIADIDATSQIMHKIKGLGCQFALDDFGVGFSSLYYLKKLPVDYVKIDGSFIRNLHNDPDSQVLVRALVEVSRAYRLRTVAEFVEGSEILDILQVLGVDYAQGYHIDQPKPFESIWQIPQRVA
ncbi:MAG: putative bifunctional diguanylate cyclase/phosphodiesterase [Gammaproteobacteria bacterium]